MENRQSIKRKVDQGLKKISSLVAKEFFKEVLPYLLLLISSAFLAIHFINPAPPKKITISIDRGSINNRAFASVYGALLSQYDIRLEIRESSGDIENIQLLKDDSSGVDLAFVQDGIARSEGAGNLQSLGSLYYESAWVLCRCKLNDRHLSSLKGKRISVGEVGDGGNVLANTLLNVSGVNKSNAKLINMSGADAVDALSKKQIDAAIIVDMSDSDLIKRALRIPDVNLMTLDDAEALSRQYSYLQHLVLPESAVDIKRNIPSQNIHIVAPTTMLIMSDKIHPALVYLMLKIIKQVHSGSGVLHHKDEFPSTKGSDFPLSTQAENFYRSGPPFLDKYLPFWASTFVSRTLIVILPLLAILLPLSKIIPFAYRTFMQWRLFRYYGELRYLESQLDQHQSLGDVDQEYYLKKLDQIESRARAIKLPISYSQHLYELRAHINLVRSKV
jgi:TRAP transporter TAXI family solute receptor